MVLTRDQARAFYDHFGKKQDTQAFYEDAALDDLIARAAFGQATRVFELGCGTGRLAAGLLAEHLPLSASYVGVDLSRTMTTIAQQRIAAYAGRATVSQSEDSLHFPLPDHSVDRVVSTYVLDLLSESDIHQVITEAQRILLPHGKLCLASLTQGVTFSSRIVSRLWSAAFRLNASWVGGCRPIRLDSFFDQRDWSVEHHAVVTQFSVPSEVLIASPISTPKPSPRTDSGDHGARAG